MATIRKRGGSYQIRVSVGYDTKRNHKEQAMTWKPSEGMTERQIQKELNRQAVMFEEACNRGFRTKAVKFEELCEEWFAEYASLNLHNTSYQRMRQLTKRVYPTLGHFRIARLQRGKFSSLLTICQEMQQTTTRANRFQGKQSYIT